MLSEQLRNIVRVGLRRYDVILSKDTISDLENGEFRESYGLDIRQNGVRKKAYKDDIANRYSKKSDR